MVETLYTGTHGCNSEKKLTRGAFIASECSPRCRRVCQKYGTSFFIHDFQLHFTQHFCRQKWANNLFVFMYGRKKNVFMKTPKELYMYNNAPIYPLYLTPAESNITSICYSYPYPNPSDF
ncbi:hypothetical protein EZS27_035651 [termite gut metagenome]|uniref:Uncharacterized protein n=1 Tax=termite gut metagenome TaxID=433724 RepID=A0A5J4PXQ1_9ZZZZ